MIGNITHTFEIRLQPERPPVSLEYMMQTDIDRKNQGEDAVESELGEEHEAEITTTTVKKTEITVNEKTSKAKKRSGKKPVGGNKAPPPGMAKNKNKTQNRKAGGGGSDDDDDDDDKSGSESESPIPSFSAVPQEHPNLVTIGLKVYTKKDAPAEVMARLPMRMMQTAEESEGEWVDENEHGSGGDEGGDAAGSEED